MNPNDPKSMAPIRDPESFVTSKDLGTLLRGFAQKESKGTEAEDLVSYILLKMIENDYRKLRDFSGLSKRSTYLIGIWKTLLIDFKRPVYGREFGRKTVGLDPPLDLKDPFLLQAWELMVKQKQPANQVYERLRIEKGYKQSLGNFLKQTETFFHHQVAARIVPANTVSLGDEQFDSKAVAVTAATQFDEVAQGQTQEVLRTVMAELDPLEKRTLVLHYMDDVPITTIAKVLDVKADTLRKRLNVVLAKLKKRMEEKGLRY